MALLLKLAFLISILKSDYGDCSCNVSEFSVQQNFDIEKYAAVAWYEVSWLPHPQHPPDTLYEDYQHTYYLHPDGHSITAFISGRKEGDYKCFYSTKEYTTTGTPGKWQRNDRHKTDYWIISTDYLTYSVVYGCRKYNSDGECLLPLAWVWARTQSQLPSNKMTTVEMILNNLCLNKSAFIKTEQYNECPVNKGCAVYSIDKRVQKDFDIKRYVGKWYEISWLPQFYIAPDELYQDYQHYYDLNSDGSMLTVFIRGRDPVDLSACFYNQGQLFPTAENGTFLYRRRINSTYFLTTMYRVMSTDYNTYAVIYGCRELDAKGLCTVADSWIWSRFPELPANKLAVVEWAKRKLCVNTSMYLPTQQNNECGYKRDCTVPSIVQRRIKTFNTDKFNGIWYKYSFLSADLVDYFADYVMEVHSMVPGEHIEARTTARFAGSRGKCQYEDVLIHTTDIPGVLKTVIKGQQDKEFNIMTITYTSYFVSYGCLSQDENLKCHKPHATLWTRSKAMSTVDFAEAKRTIVELCLNYDLFVTVDQTNECSLSSGIKKSGGHSWILLGVWTLWQLK